MHLAIVSNLNERSLAGEQTSGRIIRQNITVEFKIIWNKFRILSRFVSYPVALNLSCIPEVRVDQPKQSLLTGPCRVSWGLLNAMYFEANMHPESYDCGLPGHLVVMQAAMMEPGVHIMSDELILQISCNIFLAFKCILMMTSGQNISHYRTAKLSVHVWNHDLIWWQNDTQKHFHNTTITSSWTLSKTKIPITIVKAQMPSNPNQ